MLTLNQNYETDITFAVVVKDVPEDVTFTSQGEDVVVRVRDRGTTLMNYKLESFMPLSVNYSELINRKGRMLLPLTALQKRIKKQLQSSTSMVVVQPDTIVYYTQESALKFPVRLKGEFVPARQYAVGEISLSPDSVWVFAPMQVADTMKCVDTEWREEKELRDTLVYTIPLSLPAAANSCTPAEVTVTVPVYPYAQKSFKLPVLGIDFPETYKLRTFPSHVQVMLNVSMDNYNKIVAEDFEVGVSYLDVFESDNNKVSVKLLRAPSYATDVTIQPSLVEYIIERQ
jgi:YbbR domain-containing protein